MDLFIPFYMKVPEGREEIDKACAKVERITDGKKLVKIAIRAPHKSIRKQALEAIKGDEELARVAMECAFTDTAEAAARKIGDQGILLKVAKEAPDAVRATAVCCLKHQDDIITFADDPSPDVRRCVAAHRNVTDFMLHARMALKDPDPNVRKAAIRNPQGPVGAAVLAKVLLGDRDPEIRRMAAESERCTNSAALAKALLEDRDVYVRIAALENRHCTDQDALDRAALEDPDGYLRRLVIGGKYGKVRPEVLTKLLLEHPDPETRKAAAESKRCTDSAALVKALLEDTDAKVRCAAAANPCCTDRDALRRAALDDPNEAVRITALEKDEMNDEETLVRIAADPDRTAWERKSAVNKGMIRDQALLEQIALDTGNATFLRLAAIRYVEKAEALESLLAEEGSVRRWAAVRLARFAPEKALGTLIEELRPLNILSGNRNTGIEEEWIKEAVGILAALFKASEDPEIRKRIASMNASYGWTDYENCKHYDHTAYLDAR